MEQENVFSGALPFKRLTKGNKGQKEGKARCKKLKQNRKKGLKIKLKS